MQELWQLSSCSSHSICTYSYITASDSSRMGISEYLHTWSQTLLSSSGGAWCIHIIRVGMRFQRCIVCGSWRRILSYCPWRACSKSFLAATSRFRFVDIASGVLLHNASQQPYCQLWPPNALTKITIVVLSKYKQAWKLIKSLESERGASKWE